MGCFWSQNDKYKVQLEKNNQKLAQKIIQQYVSQQLKKPIPINIKAQYQQEPPNYNNSNYNQYPYGPNVNSNNSSNLNPYALQSDQPKTQQQLLAEETAKHQKLIAKMRVNGVNINDYYKYSGLFYQCPTCNSALTEDAKPNLRNCGHLVCQSPNCIKLQCSVPGCKQKSVVKISNYWPWAVQTSQNKQTFDFVIDYWGMNDINQVKGINENTTFEKVLWMCPFAKFFMQGIPAEHRAITICGKMFLYEDIKTKTIKSQVTNLKLKKSDAVDHYKNKLHCYNKQLGGQVQTDLSGQNIIDS